MKKTKKVILRSLSLVFSVCLLVCLCVVPAKAEDNYNSQWFNAGTYKTGSFQVYSTHSGRIGVTLKIETSSPQTTVQVRMTNANGLPILATRTLTASSPEWQTGINGDAGYYTVNYTVSAPGGTRLMCWTY